MDFGNILDTWEKQNSKTTLKEKYPDKDYEFSIELRKQYKNFVSESMKKMKPQDYIDLHGFTASEAENALRKFLLNCKTRGLRKIQIIHGKGIHSASEESVIKKVVDNVLQECSFAGKSGFSKGKEGGTGSRWVIIK